MSISAVYFNKINNIIIMFYVDLFTSLIYYEFEIIILKIFEGDKE